MLLVALSCLQGRPMQMAFDELAPLAGGVQLTPGNHPTAGFEAHVRHAVVRRHHGFDFAARRRPVWREDATCLVDAHSVHPPEESSSAGVAIRARGLGPWLEAALARGEGTAKRLLETMYPGYVLGSGAELEVAMDLGVHLAVDVSHVFMQLCQGVMTASTWRRLSTYEHVGEVHASANDGTRDAHAPMTDATFGRGWARERCAAGVPTILECYMHRLSQAERNEQVQWLVHETR